MTAIAIIAPISLTQSSLGAQGLPAASTVAGPPASPGQPFVKLVLVPLLSYCYKAILQPRASTPFVTQTESETRQVIFVPPLPPAAGQAAPLSLRRGGRTLSPSPRLAVGSGVLSGMLDCVRRHLPGGTGGYFCWETFLNNWQRKQETTALWSGARCVPMHLLFLAALVLLRRPRGDGRQRGCSLARRWSKTC